MDIHIPPTATADTVDLLRGESEEGAVPARAGLGEALEGLAGPLFDPDTLNVDELTPEVILVMLQRRLSALDSQIQMETAAIQDASKESEGLSEMIQAVGALRDAMASAESKSDEKVDLRTISVTVGDKTYDPASDLVAELGIYDDLELVNPGGASWSASVSREVVKGFIERLQVKQRSINSNNEMTMVRLQSAIGKRQQAIQLSTNMVNNINQSLMDIIRNTK